MLPGPMPTLTALAPRSTSARAALAVAWEREVRKFLRNLSPDHEHRVSPVMVYEWATGRSVAAMMAQGESASPDLRKIKKTLHFYFEKYGSPSGGKAPFQTWIGGRKVGTCYRVPAGYYIKRHRPMTLELWMEYQAGTLAI